MIDKYGLYVQANKDTGDSAHRTGCALAIQKLLKQDLVQVQVLEQLEISPGVFVRHPHGTQTWHSNPRCFSRDQASRLMLAHAVNENKEPIRRWFKQMLKRKFFHQNDRTYDTNQPKLADIMAPGEFRTLIRGLDLWHLYPALLFLDMLFIVDLYARSRWDGGSLFVIDIKYAKVKYPTPFAYLVDYLSKKTNVYQEIQHNHSAEKNGCVELQDLFKKLESL